MTKKLPLSGEHSKGFGYKDYFTKHERGKGIFRIMKKLARQGPLIKYVLKSKCNSTVEKFNWIQVHRYINTLEKSGLVKQFGIQKLTAALKKEGRKHESMLFGLTPMGIVIACLVDDYIYEYRGQIITNYQHYEKGDRKGLPATFFDKEIKGVPQYVTVHGYNSVMEWGTTEMLIQILEFTKDVDKVLPKTASIFDPEKLDAIWISTQSVDLKPFSYFFNTLSDEVIDVLHKDKKNQFDMAIKLLIEMKLLVPLVQWMKGKKTIMKISLDKMTNTVNQLEIKLLKM